MVNKTVNRFSWILQGTWSLLIFIVICGLSFHIQSNRAELKLLNNIDKMFHEAVTRYFVVENQTLVSLGIVFGFAWILGMIAISFGVGSLRRKIDNILHVERQSTMSATEYLINYDRQTGLPNQYYLNTRFQQAAKKADLNDQKLAVGVLSINNFRQIVAGHDYTAATQLLSSVAERVVERMQKDGSLAYWEGNKLLLLIDDIETMEKVVEIAREVSAAFAQPFSVKGNDYYIDASLGMALYPDDGTHCKQLIANADIARTKVKPQKGEIFGLCNEALNTAVIRQLTLENGLRTALSREQFSVVFQPQFNAASQSVEAVEALIRWHHPQLGDIRPDEFIPIAESIGEINAIGAWVLSQACRSVVRWREVTQTSLGLAVNVSPVQFQAPGFVDLVREALQNSGLPAEALELEITENTIIEDMGRTREALSRFKEMGVRIAVDDFGTGYSNLSMLKHLPIDRLKIDRSYVSEILNDDNNDILVQGIVALMDQLGVESLAEGVETHEQRDFLLECGCVLMQGYLFGRPMTAADFEKFHRKTLAENFSVKTQTYLAV